MLRPYASGQADNVRFFLGKEVERTPAFGLTTLFLVGKLTVKEATEVLDEALDKLAEHNPFEFALKHFFFGANWSFDGLDVADWSATISHFLKEGYWCTLDMRPAHIPLIQKSGLCKHARFVPLIGVRVPSAISLGNNATIKIDDTSFAGTNPGVWCFQLAELTRLNGVPRRNNNSFTPWGDYTKDIIIEPKEPK